MSVINEIKDQILNNEELDINEKMCLIALMCLGETSGYNQLAEAMGATENTAKMAFISLKQKGYFAQSDPVKDYEEIKALKEFLRREPQNTNNLIKANASKTQKKTKKPAETEKKLPSNEKKDIKSENVEKIMNLVEENLSRSEASIILGFANGDYRKVEATYSKIRGTQISDKIEALVNLLQSKDEKTMRTKSQIMSYKNNDK